MLDLRDEDERLHLLDTIASLKCDIELPKSWSDFFDCSGLVGGYTTDRRKFARWRNRALAGLLYSQTFPALPRSKQWFPVYLSDLSQSGVLFVHSEQLYPLERMHFLCVDDVSFRLLKNDHLHAIEVVWCSRVQANCYEVGARFIDT